MFGSITRTSFCFLFLPCAEVSRCTRTPTAGKEHAFARFRTTACRLRNDRTLSASGRFSTWDSPPSIALNLYSKGAAPREGLLLFSGSGYSIAVRFLFVNDLINKNQAECSAKTPMRAYLPYTRRPCPKSSRAAFTMQAISTTTDLRSHVPAAEATDTAIRQIGQNISI